MPANSWTRRHPVAAAAMSAVAVAVLVLVGVSLFSGGDEPWKGTKLNEDGYAACSELGKRVNDKTLYSKWNESVHSISRLAKASGDADLIRNAGFMANVDATAAQQTKQTAADGFAAACFDKGWDG